MKTVGIIGLGPISFDYGSPDQLDPYCHIGGIRLSKKVKLTAVADLLPEKHQKFAAKFGACFPELRSYPISTAMLAAEKFDIVGVCVRGPDHFKVAHEVLAAGPKAVFLEKPPTCSLAEMDELVRTAQARRIPITVSYSRHWNPHILKLEELIRGGLIGKVHTVVGYCGGTFLSFAAHTTDLICQFAGYCPAAVYATGEVPEQKTPLPAGYEPEPAVHTMVIEFENGVRGVQIGGHGEHGAFYADIFGSEGQARVGMYIPPAAKDGKGNPINLFRHGIPPIASVFTVAYDQIADHLSGGPLPACTDRHWQLVNEIGFAGIESVLTRQRICLPNANRGRKVFANG